MPPSGSAIYGQPLAVVQYVHFAVTVGAACDALPRVTALRLAGNAINTERAFPVSAANRT